MKTKNRHAIRVTVGSVGSVRCDLRGFVARLDQSVEVGHANHPEPLVVAEDNPVHLFTMIRENLRGVEGCELEGFLCFHDDTIALNRNTVQWIAQYFYNKTPCPESF